MKKAIWMAVCAVLLCGGLQAASTSAARADHGGRNGDAKTSVRAKLTGAAINGLKPEGHADFRSEGTRLKFEVEAERLNLADGAIVSVQVNGKLVGMIKLVNKQGELELDSKNGAAVPAIQKGDVVTVIAPTGETLLTGTF